MGNRSLFPAGERSKLSRREAWPQWGLGRSPKRPVGRVGGEQSDRQGAMRHRTPRARGQPLRAVCPRNVVRLFRPLGRNSLTTFRGQTALRGCPRPRLAALTRREKALDCPFLKEGVRNVARSTVELPTWTFVRARAHSFPLSKRARLFPSAAYRRSAPPQVALGRLNQCELGCYGVGWMASLYP